MRSTVLTAAAGGLRSLRTWRSSGAASCVLFRSVSRGAARLGAGGCRRGALRWPDRASGGGAFGPRAAGGDFIDARTL